MRIIFDVECEAQVCGGGGPYRNPCGFQGVDDIRMSVTIMLPSVVAGKPDDVLEFDGSGKLIAQMLRNALDSVDGTLSFSKKECGPKRELPCPDCDPQTIYPNATHTEDCAATKYWAVAARAQKSLDKVLRP